MEPKVLVISNECFSKTSSNGRTLGNFFSGWSKDKLAQFYISSGTPDFNYCTNYFRVTDGQALSAFKSGHCYGGCVKNNQETSNTVQSTAKKKKKKKCDDDVSSQYCLGEWEMETMWIRATGEDV